MLFLGFEIVSVPRPRGVDEAQKLFTKIPQILAEIHVNFAQQAKHLCVAFFC